MIKNLLLKNWGGIAQISHFYDNSLSTYYRNIALSERGPQKQHKFQLVNYEENTFCSIIHYAYCKKFVRGEADENDTYESIFHE